MGRVLAIDYGKRRIGIAVTDPLRIIAKPLLTIENKDLQVWLDKYLIAEEVDIIVVGMPMRMDGSATHVTEEIATLIEGLKIKYSHKVIATIDERLTIKMAMQSLIDSGVPKQKRKEKGALDSVSASLILQTYLETIK
jgi:putative holliday junction resolvase